MWISLANTFREPVVRHSPGHHCTAGKKRKRLGLDELIIRRKQLE